MCMVYVPTTVGLVWKCTVARSWLGRERSGGDRYFSVRVSVPTCIRVRVYNRCPPPQIPSVQCNPRDLQWRKRPKTGINRLFLRGHSSAAP